MYGFEDCQAKIAELEAKIAAAEEEIAYWSSVANDPQTPEAIKQRVLPRIARAKLKVARWKARLEMLKDICEPPHQAPGPRPDAVKG